MDLRINEILQNLCSLHLLEDLVIKLLENKGRKFKSCHPDKSKSLAFMQGFFLEAI